MGCRASMAAEDEEGFLSEASTGRRGTREKKDGTTERSNKLLPGCIDPDLPG